jgi:hypothetical protein
MEQEKNNSLTDQYKKKKLTPEEEAEIKDERLARQKKKTEEGTIMGEIKKGLKEWYDFNLGSGPERRGSIAK